MTDCLMLLFENLVFEHSTSVSLLYNYPCYKTFESILCVCIRNAVNCGLALKSEIPCMYKITHCIDICDNVKGLE